MIVADGKLQRKRGSMLGSFISYPACVLNHVMASSVFGHY